MKFGNKQIAAFTLACIALSGCSDSSPTNQVVPPPADGGIHTSAGHSMSEAQMLDFANAASSVALPLLHDYFVSGFYLPRANNQITSASKSQLPNGVTEYRFEIRQCPAPDAPCVNPRTVTVNLPSSNEGTVASADLGFVWDKGMSPTKRHWNINPARIVPPTKGDFSADAHTLRILNLLTFTGSALHNYFSYSINRTRAATEYISDVKVQTSDSGITMIVSLSNLKSVDSGKITLTIPAKMTNGQVQIQTEINGKRAETVNQTGRGSAFPWWLFLRSGVVID